MPQKLFFRDKQGRIRYTGPPKTTSESLGQKEGRFITKDDRVIFIGGPSSGSGGTGSFRRFNSLQEAVDYAKSQPFSTPVSAEQEWALRKYILAPGEINRPLRSGKTPYSPYDKALENIDEVMQRPESVVREGFEVRRHFGAGFFNDKPVGYEFSDPAFMSTSMRSDWHYSVATTVRVTPGTRGVFLPSTARGDLSECEFLINRGQRYRVVQNDSNGVVVDVIGQD